MSGELLNSLVNLSDLRPKPPHPVACIGAYIGPVDAKNHCWEIKSSLKDQCQTQICVEIQKYLEDHFGTVPSEDRITVSFYMIGKNPQTASPTVLFISENPEYRKDARKAVKESGIMPHYPGFKTAHSSKDPGFQKLEQLASNGGPTAGLEMQNHLNISRLDFQGGTSEIWPRTTDPESIHARLARADVFYSEDERLSAPRAVEPHAMTISTSTSSPIKNSPMEVWFDHTQTLKTFGMALYVRHPSFIRKATANAIQLRGRLFFQMALHPFLLISPPKLETITGNDNDDDFEIDSDTGSYNENQEDHDVAMTSTGSRTPNTGTQSPELQSGSSRRSSEVRELLDGPSEDPSSNSEPLHNASDKLVAFAAMRPAYEPQELVVPSSTSLSVLGKLVSASVSTDWALVEINDSKVEDGLKADKRSYTMTMDRIAWSPKDDVGVRTCTATHGELTGILSACPSYARLPHSKTIQKVYVVRFDGPLADGDCGSVVIGTENGQVYGHLVAGCRTTGSAYVLAASEVAEDIRKFCSYRAEVAGGLARATDDPSRLRSTSLAQLEGASMSVNPQTASWVRDLRDESVHARLARAGVHFEEPLDESPQHAECPRSTRTNSSRASSMGPFVHHAARSARAPSLSGYTEATPTETSISTGLANHLSGAQLLEENNGVLELPRTQVPVPVYECAFWFLNCGYISQNQEEWMTHCESHFRGEEPPRSVQCPLCEWTIASSNDGRMSWHARMQHVATEHTMLGQTLRTSRPDFDLYRYLWKMRLIDDQDYKELQGGNHNLARRPGNFTETGGRERRRDRDERRHRRQHVTATRPSGPHPV